MILNQESRETSARPNLYSKCDLDFPTGVGKDEASKLGKFTVRAANLPATQIGNRRSSLIRGRVLKIAGDRTFEPWTITIHER